MAAQGLICVLEEHGAGRSCGLGGAGSGTWCGGTTTTSGSSGGFCCGGSATLACSVGLVFVGLYVGGSFSAGSPLSTISVFTDLVQSLQYL